MSQHLLASARRQAARLSRHHFCTPARPSPVSNGSNAAIAGTATMTDAISAMAGDCHRLLQFIEDHMAECDSLSRAYGLYHIARCVDRADGRNQRSWMVRALEGHRVLAALVADLHSSIEQDDALTPAAFSGAVWAVAKLLTEGGLGGHLEAQLVDRVADAVRRRLHKLTPRQLTTLLWSLSKLPRPLTDVFTDSARWMAEAPASFWEGCEPRSIAQLLAVYAALPSQHVHNTAFIDVLVARLRGRASGADFHTLSTAVFALSRLGKRDHVIFKEVADAVMEREMADMSVKDLSRVMVAYSCGAHPKNLPQGFADRLADGIRRDFGRLDCRGLCSAVWTLSKMLPFDHPFFRQLSVFLCGSPQLFRDFTAPDVSQMVLVYANVEAMSLDQDTENQLFALLNRSVRLQLKWLDAQALVDTLWGLSRVRKGLRDHRLLAEAVQHIEGREGKLSNRQLCRLLSALANVEGCVSERSIARVKEAVKGRLGSMGGRELQMVAGALVRLRVRDDDMLMEVQGRERQMRTDKKG
mmetsp:Transcript_40500/g.115430  ORF Transcript_40500/g.115430 Transcript_40500/m.115430 type:complete len:527 (+) Transcript_40500:87-1667(+)